MENVLNFEFVTDIPPPKNNAWQCINCERIFVFDRLKGIYGI